MTLNSFDKDFLKRMRIDLGDADRRPAAAVSDEALADAILARASVGVSLEAYEDAIAERDMYKTCAEVFADQARASGALADQRLDEINRLRGCAVRADNASDRLRVQRNILAGLFLPAWIGFVFFSGKYFLLW